MDSGKEKAKKVTGIGGIFVKCDDPKKMREWYGSQLGFAINDFGSMFEYKTMDEPSKSAYTLWSTFPKTSKYFDKEYMINFKVEGIEGLVGELKKNNVTVLDDIQDSEYGKFVHIMDPEGNKLELWEPKD